MRLTKARITTDHDNHYTPKRKLRGGADMYYIHYTKEGHGLAFTLNEFDAAAERFAKLDEGDTNFPHRWTFLRWVTNHFNYGRTMENTEAAPKSTRGRKPSKWQLHNGTGVSTPDGFVVYFNNPKQAKAALSFARAFGFIPPDVADA